MFSVNKNKGIKKNPKVRLYFVLPILGKKILSPTLSLTKSGDEYTLMRKGTLRGDRSPLKFK
jgi:hypothetical protein